MINLRYVKYSQSVEKQFCKNIFEQGAQKRWSEFTTALKMNLCTVLTEIFNDNIAGCIYSFLIHKNYDVDFEKFASYEKK